MKKNGFTLFELMIVLAIIGMLVAVTVPAYKEYTRRSRCADDQVCLNQVNAQIRDRQYPLPNGYRPPVVNNSVQCVSGYVILPSGSQLLDTNGHGIRC